MAKRFSSDELADLLEDIARAVRSGDSLEGSLRYRLPIGYEGVSDNTLMVDAAIRTGNLAGQGSMILIGEQP